MQAILQGIIESNVLDSNCIYKTLKDESYLIIKDKDGNESDFFLFQFLDGLPSNDSFEKTFKEFGKLSLDKNNEKNLSNFPSFDKNTNLVIFIKVKNDLGLTDKEIKDAYIIEENPYFFRKKVIFYTQEQIDGFGDNFELSLDGFDAFLSDIKNSNKRFLLNLLSGLTFIKLKFNSSDNINLEKNIFQESFENINKNEEYNLGDNFEEFNKKIKNIYEGMKNDDTINYLNLTEFEESLLGLFTNPDNIKKNILSHNTTNSNEDI